MLTSLNRKKPDIVENLNIEYFKIVERDKSIGPIKVLVLVLSILEYTTAKFIAASSISSSTSKAK